MGKSEVYLTSFDVSPVEYFDLMLDTVVQQEIHTSKDGLNMSVWRASDGPLLGVPNGTSRVVFSEPDLKVPKFLKKLVQKAQSTTSIRIFILPSWGAMVMTVKMVEKERIERERRASANVWSSHTSVQTG